MQGTFNDTTFNQSVFNSGDIVIYLLPCTIVGVGKVLSVMHADYSLSLPLMAVTGAPIVGNVTGIVSIVLPLGNVTGSLISLQFAKVLAHMIYQGQYLSQPIKTNKVYVIGRDTNGNLVFGKDSTSTDITDYGEVLRIITESAIPTAADANTVADNVLSNARFDANRGQATILPNCGMEIGDAIQITDAVANQSAQKYRVMGFDFVYDPTQKETKFEHTIKLTAV